ncbi:TadE/TadG family type IV pilus assembly protein [Streptomyces sp. NPDC051211]|uniref:TadE/TadG family type IV pilus assembly protein n=1 Tax=Streptomyces sp. NPDC051211 TaxID=3154643 RepID=UPI00344D094C
MHAHTSASAGPVLPPSDSSPSHPGAPGRPGPAAPTQPRRRLRRGVRSSAPVPGLPGAPGRPGRTAPTQPRRRLRHGAARAGAPVPGARRAHRDRGQAALEYLGFLPILLLIALAGIQLGWIAYVEQQAENAARVAARTAARTDIPTGEAAGRDSIKESIRGSAIVGVSGTDALTATVTIPVNSIVPGLSFEPRTRTATMPNDDPEGP